jgi:hypothetical protein
MRLRTIAVRAGLPPHGLVAGLLACVLLALGAGRVSAQNGTVSGTVRSADGNPVAAALVTIATDRLILTARSGNDGRFALSDVPAGRHEMRVSVPGFAPWSRVIELTAGGSSAVEVTLQPAAQRLDSVAVLARRPGVYGVIGDITDLKPLAGAVVQVVGSRSADTTDESGVFAAPKVAAGRSYMIRITKPGYLTRTVSIAIPARSGFELQAYLTPADGEEPNLDVFFREFDNRVAYGGNNAALVTRSDLGDNLRSSIFTALRHSRTLIQKGLRFHQLALGDPLSPTYPCVFVNGRLAPRTTTLDYFSVGEIESVEVYGGGTLQFDRLAGRLAAVIPGRVPCGAAPSRVQTFGDGTKGPVYSVESKEIGHREMVAVVVIWLRQ